MVKLDFRRKMALASVLCLSVFMMIIAIVRVAAGTLPGGVTDTAWLFFWQTMEAAVAVIIVSLTAMKSLIGVNAATSSKKGLIYKPNSADSNSQNRTREQYNQTHSTSSGTSAVAKPVVGLEDQEDDIEELTSLDPNAHVTNEASVCRV